MHGGVNHATSLTRVGDSRVTGGVHTVGLMHNGVVTVCMEV